MMRATTIAACAGLLMAACVSSDETREAAFSAAAPKAVASKDSSGAFERDRASILAMAGSFEVDFDFIETASFAPDYNIKPRKRSGGHEVVQVIEDRGDFISLQHILVVGGERKFPIKHWRQDWRYEPSRVLVHVGDNAWAWRDLPEAERQGAWSQTVYQVDDAPRYGAVGRWSYERGAPEWSPPAEWRPLPRRDATTRDDYDVIDAINRHALTPTGWVHEQDNSKLVLRDGAPEILVREVAVNTYRRSDAVAVAVATEWWDATALFWAGVRRAWSDIEARHDIFGLTIRGEPEELYGQILALADAVAAGVQLPEVAAGEARTIIEAYVGPGAPARRDTLAGARSAGLSSGFAPVAKGRQEAE